MKSRQLALALPRLSVRDLASVLFFACLTALGARITLPLPFTPVPLTMQVVPVLLSGLMLGWRRGAASQVAYLLAIASGLPLDARMLGPLALFGPTGGYLLGFVVAAAIAGWVSERVPSWRARHFPAAVSGLVGLYVCGTLWLAVYLRLAPDAAVRLGVLPFVLPDLAKALLAAAIAIVPGSRNGRPSALHRPGR